MNPGRLGWAATVAVLLAAALVYRARRAAVVSTNDIPPAQLAPPALSSSQAERDPTPSAPREPAAPAEPSATQAATATNLVRIRAALERAPKQALELIDAADRAGAPDPFREERAMLKVEALVKIGEIGLARDATEGYLMAYPNGAYAQHLEALTGVHPHPTEAP